MSVSRAAPAPSASPSTALLGLTGDHVPHDHANTKSPALSELRVAKRMAPGQDGAKRLSLRYGDQLVCVRHRLDQSGNVRYTTVELLVERTPVVRTGDRPVALRLKPTEKSTRSLLLACGGQWDNAAKHWLVARKVAKSLGLLDRVVAKTG